MDLLETKTWVIFYLLSFVTLLWAMFLSIQGVMLWISSMLAIIIVGINGAVVYGEIRRQVAKKERIRRLFTADPSPPQGIGRTR